MAKKKKQIDTKYRVYYDSKTGSIFSVTNEVNSNYDSAIEPSEFEINKLLTGEWSFLDYKVGYKKLSDNTVIKGIVPSLDTDFSFKHTSFEWIKENNENSEMLVEWNYLDKVWRFRLSPSFKKNCKELFVNKLLFFITLSIDFNFLIRTIEITAQELLDTEFIEVPFDNKLELDISKISICSKLSFKSYSLSIIYE